MNYIEYFNGADKRLATILGNAEKTLPLHSNIALRLTAAIISQQLSTKVAAIIFQRFLNLFDGAEPSSAQVLATPYETLRSIGLSHAKATYVQAVAQFCVENNITDAYLLALSDEQIIALLTQIKGVGQWTCEMLLMFTLGRQDVFAADDLGIQQAMIRLYGLDTSNKKQLKADMLSIAETWRPYRSFACLHLWAWKDAPPPLSGD